jgi:predicted RND superfamily exporter protein
MSMVLVSILLGIVPLLGIVWTVMNGTITTVDGLFLSLILASLSGIFFLNAFLELRRGLKDEVPARESDKAQKASQGG